MLLSRRMRRSAKKGSIQFVGHTSTSLNATSGSLSLSGTLVDGIGASPIEGDIVVAILSTGSATSDVTFTSGSGFTKLIDLYANSTNDTNTAIFYKIMTSTPDTSFAWDVGATARLKVVYLIAFRGVNLLTPFDATTTTATVTNSGVPDSPSITTATHGTVVVAIGSAAGAVIGSRIEPLTAPSGMENFQQRGSDQNRVGFATLKRESIAGAYDPPAFGGGNAATDCSHISATIALRVE